MSFFIITKLIILSRYSKTSNKVLWFFVLFALTSYLPYAVIGKTYAYLDSRYYYLGAVGASFLLAWVLSCIASRSKVWGHVLSVLACLFIFTHVQTVRGELEKQTTVASERKQLLSQLNEQLPALNDNRNIFLITGSQDFYLPGNKVPFQNGFGHTLAVWYYNRGKVSKQLIKDQKLFEIGSQGYYEYDDLGFGYFSDPDVLESTLSEYKTNLPTVTNLFYDSQQKTLKLQK